MGRRTPWTDWAQILFGRRCPRRNHVVQIWWRSVKGFRVGWGSKFTLSHWLWWSSLQHSHTTVWACSDECCAMKGSHPRGPAELVPGGEWSRHQGSTSGGQSGARTRVQVLSRFAWVTTRLTAMTVQQFTLVLSMLTQQLPTRDLTYSSFTFHMILHKLLKYEYLMTTCLHMAFVSHSHLPPGEPRDPGGVVPPPNPRGWKFKTGAASLDCQVWYQECVQSNCESWTKVFDEMHEQS